MELAFPISKFHSKMMADTIESLNRMAPIFNAAIEHQRRTEKALRPILNTIRTLEPTINIMASIAQNIRPGFGPFLGSETTTTKLDVAKPESHSLPARPEPVVQLPQNANWYKLEVWLIDRHTIKVIYDKKFIGKYDHIKLGFGMKNTRDLRPNILWELLLKFSVVQEYEEYDWKPTVENLVPVLETSRKNVEKRKENLGDQFQIAFGIYEDPFTYNSNLGYQPKFRLRPIPDLREGEEEPHASGGRLFKNITGEYID